MKLFMLGMLEENRHVASRENRISKIVGGTSIGVVFYADGPTKHVIRAPLQLEYCTTENLSTFAVANPHSNMLGVFKQPLVHEISFLLLLGFRSASHDTQGISWLDFFTMF